MSSRKVVITRPLMKEIFKKYEQTPNIHLVTWENDSPAPRNWIIDNIKDASSVLVMLSDKVDKELLSNANKLKCISTMSVGIDHCDLNILKSLNIKLANTPILVEATSEIAILLYLSAMRRLKESLRFIDNGSWPQIGWGPLLLSGYQSTSKTIGFLGFGRIAQETCRKLSVFGIKNVIYTDSGKHDRTERDKQLSNKFGVNIQRVNLESLAKNSDALIILASMSHSGMKHLVNREFLNLMKKSSILINVARGPIVDTHALDEAVKNNVIAGAGLDVIEGEPNINNEHPIVKNDKIVLLPHIGSSTIETRFAMADLSLKNAINGALDKDLEYEIEF